MISLKSSQEEILEYKISKGFNTTDICKEFCFLQGELSEAFQAWLKQDPNLDGRCTNLSFGTL